MNASILVVEDEAIIARDVKKTLEGLGYLVPHPVASGEQALEAILAHPPDLVLMDIRIQGDMDGIETASLIGKNDGPPIIYLTSYSDDATLARAKVTGAYGYVLKPFQDRDLRTAIEVALHKRELEGHQSKRERLAAIGILSAGMAHEINNPLAYVLANVSFAVERLRELKEKLQQQPGSGANELASRIAEVTDALGDALEGSGRVNRIVRDLKKLGRLDETDVKVPKVNDVLDKDSKNVPVAEPASVRRGRVLVVDDEPAIGRAVRKVLEREHDVFVLTDARQALALVTGGEVFDVVFCDLMMPEMTGMAFFDALWDTNPAMARRIVFITGGAITGRTEDFLRTTSNAALAKPFEPIALRRIVADYAARATPAMKKP